MPNSDSLVALERLPCRILGVSITPVRIADIVSWLSDRMCDHRFAVLLGHNLHSVYLHHTNASLRRSYDLADLILADGAPILWDYRVSGGHRPCARLGSTDWIPHLTEVVGLNQMLVVGAGADANLRCVRVLRELFGGKVSVEGVVGEAWTPSRSLALIATVRAKHPQIILIGLGMPLQEQVIEELRAAELHGVVVAAVGGAIDQLAGMQRNAPRWLGPLGIEWLWRLASQPRRLAGRYLVEPWLLIGIRLRQSIRGK